MTAGKKPVSLPVLGILVLAAAACSTVRPAVVDREQRVVTQYESFHCAEGTSCVRTVNLTYILEKNRTGAGSLKIRVRVGSDAPSRLGERCSLTVDAEKYELAVTDRDTQRARLRPEHLKDADADRAPASTSYEKRMRYTFFLSGTIGIDDAVRDALKRAREARMSVQAGDETTTIGLSRHDLELVAGLVDR
jgi:hypothetical protein